jgi:hypothetical protein
MTLINGLKEEFDIAITMLTTPYTAKQLTAELIRPGLMAYEARMASRHSMQRGRHEAMAYAAGGKPYGMVSPRPPPLRTQPRSEQRGSMQRAARSKADSQTARAMGAAAAIGSKCHDWIVDSGATHRVTGELGRLTNLRELDTDITVTFGNGFAAAPVQCGDAVIYIKSGEATHSIMLTDVFYVPSAAASLISVTRSMTTASTLPSMATAASSATISVVWQRRGVSTVSTCLARSAIADLQCTVRCTRRKHPSMAAWLRQ